MKKKPTSIIGSVLPAISEQGPESNLPSSPVGRLSLASPGSNKSSLFGSLKRALTIKTETVKARVEDDPNRGIEERMNKKRVLNMVVYTTDFMRTVLESGHIFTSSHFFILMLQMTPEDLQPENKLVQFLPVLIKELGITDIQFSTFIDGLLD
jgi:hypothetical protein